MKIGIDIRMLGRKRTGDESVFFNLVKQLALFDTVNEYSLFIDHRSPEEIISITSSLGIEDKENFRLVMLASKNKFTWNAWVLPQYLRKHPLDVYHTQYIVPLFVASTVRVFTHIHDVSFRVYPEYIHWKDRLFLGFLIPYSLRRADTIIAVSEFTKQEIIRRYQVDKEKVAVVTNALSDDFLFPEAPDEIRDSAVATQYQLPKHYILYVGTLQPRKNIPALLRAFADVRDRLPEMKLVIVGNRSGYHYDKAIDTTIEALHLHDRVIFPGFVDQVDLPRVMRMAQAFVFPSMYEGFGLPVLEAMSQRVPVVASDIPSLREVAGEAALFADANDLAKFSETLYTISTMAKVRTELIARSEEQIHRFSWSESAQVLYALYMA